MLSNDPKKQQPVLARKYHCNNDDSIDSDEVSVLHILPPIKGKKKATINDDKKQCIHFSDSDTDDDDVDDSFLLNSKRTFEKKENQNQIKKREREVQKEKEKEERTKKRREAKEEREFRKLEESVAKKKQNEKHSQATGKYSHQEIAVLLDTDLCKEDPYGLIEKLKADFLVHPYPSSLGSPATAIQFVRKDKLQGGAEHAVAVLESSQQIGSGIIDKDNYSPRANECGYEHLRYLAVIFEPENFIPLLRRYSQDEDDDYPALQSWLDSIRLQWKHVWNIHSSSNIEPKLILILRDLTGALDKKWVDYRRHDGRRNNNNNDNIDCPLPTIKEVQDAMQWLLVQFQVECIECPDNELIQSTIHKMTRSLCETRYKKQVTELECIKKIKQGCTASDTLLNKAKDVWLRQLQQLPGLSEAKAQHVVEHYPTCQHLWQSYQWEYYQQHQSGDESNAILSTNDISSDRNCSSLLEDNFSSDKKCYKKLSDSVYRVMTSNDPNEMIL